MHTVEVVAGAVCAHRQNTTSIMQHNLANATDDAGLSAWTMSVHADALRLQRRLLPLAPPDHPPAVTLTVTNSAYESGFDNWLAATRAALTTPAVAATDRGAYEFFTRRGVHALLLVDSQALAFNRRSLYIKTALPARLLDAGLKVIFSEMDVFWSADPQLIEDPSLDLQSSEQGYGSRGAYLNFGFYLAQPTRPARRLFHRLARWSLRLESGCQDDTRPFCWDQALYDYAIRGDASALANPREALCGGRLAERAKSALRPGGAAGAAPSEPAGDLRRLHAKGRSQVMEDESPTVVEELGATRGLHLQQRLLGARRLQLGARAGAREAAAEEGTLTGTSSTSSERAGSREQVREQAPLRWGVISYELLPHPYKWHRSKIPQQISRETIALGGVLAVHLWSTVSPMPPAERIACARHMGFWALPPHSPMGAPLRVAPLLAAPERTLPNERLFYREALVQVLGQLRRARATQLARWGYRADLGQLGFVPVQRHGAGRWPDGRMVDGAPELPKGSAGRLNYSAPGGKCAAGMFVWRRGEIVRDLE